MRSILIGTQGTRRAMSWPPFFGSVFLCAQKNEQARHGEWQSPPVRTSKANVQAQK